jgi:hypothetical protein
MFLDYINQWAFWIALGIGMLLAYVLSPTPKIVYKYPTPENAGNVMYVDKTGVCYRYNAVPVKCPADESQVEPIVRE